jgi:hypothetical protein
MTLRDEFGDIIKWKAILIVELVLLVVFGSMIFPQIASDLFKQEPEHTNTKPPPQAGPPPPPRPPSWSFLGLSERPGVPSFTGVVLTESADCEWDTYWILMVEDETQIKVIVEYSKAYGKFYEGEQISGNGDFVEDIRIAAKWVSHEPDDDEILEEELMEEVEE